MAETVIIGLTGPTGSGKSTVAGILRELGCAVIDCDKKAKWVLDNCAACRESLQKEFGDDVIGTDGTLDRKLLAKRAFSSPEKTERLNGITHPWILRALNDEIGALKKKGNRFIIVDAPLLFESGADAVCDRILTVTAPLKIRLERIMLRDGIDREAAVSRIRAQHGDAYYIEKSDYFISGTTSLGVLRKDVAAFLCRAAGDGDEKKG